MGTYIISSDFYTIKRVKNSRLKRRPYTPFVSVIIPAHNEENTIERALTSLYESSYPKKQVEVIVVNDGSKDSTRKLVEQFKKSHRDGPNIRLLNRVNKGKAAALNYALKNAVRGSLVMCLDADSYLAKDALFNAVQHFRDRTVVTLSSNVNIVEDGTLLTLVQRFEYLICYQMKKGQALLGVEYIVGGIGSMFRHSILKRVSFYDTNTMTEDIDLTMKIISSKARKQRIAYAADSIVFTEAAHSLKELKTQRYRWKYGRSQTFLKNVHIFFDRDNRYAKRLAWFALPFALLQDVIFFTEPLILAYFLFLTVRFGDLSLFRNALFVITVYVIVNVWSSEHLKLKEKLRLSYYAPTMYLFMYILSYAEYYALIKSLILSPKLAASLNSKHTTWKSPERRKEALA